MEGKSEGMRYREEVLKYAAEAGVTEASRRYGRSRQYIYRWRRRYDGSEESLRERPRRPHQHPRAHREEEVEQIGEMVKRNPGEGLVVMWVKLRREGYERSLSGLYRVLKREGWLRERKVKGKKERGEYEKMKQPGERVQVDVKEVPEYSKGRGLEGRVFYQYTAIDEYSRWRYVEGFAERNGERSAEFMRHLVEAFPAKIECVQTDNGVEFRGRKERTLFQLQLAQCGIRHKLIRAGKPQHNGKVERSHRKDNERFYRRQRFESFEEFCEKLEAYNREDYNDFPMQPLGWKTPNEVLYGYLEEVSQKNGKSGCFPGGAERL